MAKMKWMKKPKPELHIVSLSGGKDSTAMLLRMLEEGMHIDIILFCDTGIEFPAMYRHLEKLQRDIGRPITRVCSNHTFEHFLLQHEVRVKRTKVEVSEKKRRHSARGHLYLTEKNFTYHPSYCRRCMALRLAGGLACHKYALALRDKGISQLLYLRGLSCAVNAFYYDKLRFVVLHNYTSNTE